MVHQDWEPLPAPAPRGIVSGPEQSWSVTKPSICHRAPNSWNQQSDKAWKAALTERPRVPRGLLQGEQHCPSAPLEPSPRSRCHQNPLKCRLVCKKIKEMVSTEREKPEIRENQSGSLVLKGKTTRWHLFSLALPTTVRNLQVLKNGLEILFLYQMTYFFLFPVRSLFLWPIVC